MIGAPWGPRRRCLRARSYPSTSATRRSVDGRSSVEPRLGKGLVGANVEPAPLGLGDRSRDDSSPLNPAHQVPLDQPEIDQGEGEGELVVSFEVKDSEIDEAEGFTHGVLLMVGWGLERY